VAAAASSPSQARVLMRSMDGRDYQVAARSIVAMLGQEGTLDLIRLLETDDVARADALRLPASDGWLRFGQQPAQLRTDVMDGGVRSRRLRDLHQAA
jgi:hypothetical protein